MLMSEGEREGFLQSQRMRSPMGPRRRTLALAAILSLALAAPARARHKGPDPREGLLSGVVVDAGSQKPIVGALVAAFDKKHRPIAWGRTDGDGRYALVARPLHALNLDKEGHGGGLLAGLFHTVGKVVETAAGVTLDAAKAVAGVTVGQQTMAAAVSAIGTTGSGPAPGDQFKAQIAERTGRTASQEAQGTLGLAQRPNPGKHSASQGQKQPAALPTAGPGQLLLRVVQPNYQEFQGLAAVYWMEPPVKQRGEMKVGPQAWLDPILLAPRGQNQPSRVSPVRILLQDGKLEPDMTTVGATVQVSVSVSAPKQDGIDFRVFLVDDRADTVVELKPAGGERYSGELAISKNHPLGATLLTIAALRTRPVTVDVSRAKQDLLPRLAAKLEDLKPDAAYEYDPRILASQNRLDLKLLVLDPRHGMDDPTTIPTRHKPEITVPPPVPTQKSPPPAPGGNATPEPAR
jgi:hypothetical protein